MADIITIKNIAPRFGHVTVDWTRNEDEFSIRITSESDVPKHVIMPNGKEYEFTENSAFFTCKV